MEKYGTAILNALLDQYEGSKSFTGKNVRNQSFSKRITDLFPGYADDANFELFSEVNLQAGALEEEGLVTVKRRKRGKADTDVIYSVTLAAEKLGQCYGALGRRPKADRNAEVRKLLDEYRNRTPLLYDFCKEQDRRLAENRKAQYSDDLGRLEQILKALAEIEKVGEETFIRNFSVRVLGDSKAFEHIKGAVASLLCEYGGYPDKGRVLRDLNIVSNPGHVYVKGKGTVTVSGQVIDFGRLNGDFGLGSAVLDDIEEVRISASKVVTVENLTAFNSFADEDAFAVYLGGYHNSIRRRMIRKIYEDNPDKKYFHCGDIDAGGFYILLDLRRKTGIPFAPLNMGLGTIKKYRGYAKKLTDNDRGRLRNLLGGEFDEVIAYMLENDCKLEQEAVWQGGQVCAP